MNAGQQLIGHLERKLVRDVELDALMDRYDEAKAAGFKLNDRDAHRLLALLLDDRLDGIGNYESHYRRPQ